MSMHHTNTHTVITTACNTPQSRDAIVAALLQGRLAACVQVAQVQSHYWWEGKITQAEEFLLTIKTQKMYSHMVEETIRANHPYQTPEILELPVEAGNAAYLEWIDDATKPELNKP